jgi:pimeloyl-ACP methyl ester carboxylesterase
MFFILHLFSFSLFSQNNDFKFENTSSFYPNEDRINQEDITWGYHSVPENWDKPEGVKIKMAVAILRNTSKNKNTSPVIYIEGNLGAGSINGIWSWLNHPLRKNKDIVLVDIRGVGFSKPKLCPNLGRIFLEILATNQNYVKDEQDKTIATLACKQDLISRNIDIINYNSKSIAKDLNALRKVLKYENWNVFGVSYGTQLAQVYANDFPNDIKSLILDSPVSNVSEYYNKNTTNYNNSLNKVFEACNQDPNCNKQYPNLEHIYYETIRRLEKQPITVQVDKNIITEGTFTYNVEDFKIAIHQALYQKSLIEVLPLLIYQFNQENKAVLGALITAFSGALGLDYGVYYCVSCAEVIPLNSISEFNQDASKYENLKGGLSFYKSDFTVCEEWNKGSDKLSFVPNELSNLSILTVPVLVFSGGFDPITPDSNGEITQSKFKNGFLVNAPNHGHAPSFSKTGYKIITEFINNPNQKPDTNGFQNKQMVNFVNDVNVNEGIFHFSNSLNELNLLFLSPFLIAVIILLFSIFIFIFSLISSKIDTKTNKILKFLIVLTSFSGLFCLVGFIVAVNNTAYENFYILAFGLSSSYNYLFVIQLLFIVLLVITILYFLFKIRKISDVSIVTSILFSCVLMCTYFYYFGFFK